MIKTAYITGTEALDRMMEIEQKSFSFPWTRQDVVIGLRQSGRLRFIGLWEGDTLQAWGCFAPAIWEAHLMTIAVHPDARRRGLGSALLKAIELAAADAGAQYMALECRAGNKNAQRFYEKNGYKCVGLQKGYYTDTGEDAYLYLLEPLPEGDCERDPWLIRE